MNKVSLAFDEHRGPVRRLLLGHKSRSNLPIVAVVLTGSICAASLWRYGHVQHQLVATQHALDATRTAGTRPTAAPAPLLSAQQTMAWNQLARQLNTPWSLLLDTLEENTPETIALVAIEPDSRQGSVKLIVEAKALDPLLAYASALRQIGAFNSVMLVKHETNEQDPVRPVRLSIDLRLAPRQTAGASS